MIEIASEGLELRCRNDGTQVTLVDRKRGIGWRLDEGTRRYRLKGEEMFRVLGAGTAVVAEVRE